jgi:hypothetical protein
MEPWMLAIVLKPIGLIVLFSFTWYCAHLARKHLPDGKLKRFLFISWRV